MNELELWHRQSTITKNLANRYVELTFMLTRTPNEEKELMYLCEKNLSMDYDFALIPAEIITEIRRDKNLHVGF